MHKSRIWLEINKSSFNKNISFYKNNIGTKQLGVVVKSNAYGHGLQEIAQLCEHNKQIDWLCTALLSESLYLRTIGIIKPIVTLGIYDADLQQAAKNNIDVVIFDTHSLQQALAVTVPLNVHIKVDTGLSRLGFLPHEVFPIIQKIKQSAFLKLNGLYTHLAESANPDTSFTQQQISSFELLLTQLNNNNIIIPHIHVANSAGVFFAHSANMTRIGAGAYGILPNTNLQPIATLKTSVMSIKKIKKGDFIGYDRTAQAHQDMTLATLPIGYYDGYPRNLSNKGIVLINNQYAPVVGRVAMNITTIDITTINTKIGDTVIVMGPHEHVTPHDIAQKTGSGNPREIVTNLNAHIPKIIVERQLIIAPSAQQKLNVF